MKHEIEINKDMMKRIITKEHDLDWQI